MIYSDEYKIGQSSATDSNSKGYYKWAIWMEPGTSPLSEIASVEYLLHPTFKNRLRTVTDAETKFRLESKGWGEFLVEITVIKKSGEPLRLTHWLTLGDNHTTVEEDAESPDFEGKNVYISYSKIDSRRAKMLESLLTDLGMLVTSGSHYQAGVPIEEYIENSISSADFVVNIDSSRPTAWHQSELEFAHKKSKEVISVNDILNTEDPESSLNLKGSFGNLSKTSLKTLGNNLNKLKS